MSQFPINIVTVRDAIHAGMRLGLGQTKTLDLWREMGGEIRDIDFAKAWREEAEAFDKWRRNSLTEISDTP